MGEQTNNGSAAPGRGSPSASISDSSRAGGSRGGGACICILDYGMGNLRSVEKALEHVGATATISSDAGAVRDADGVILPGVGAFPRAMERVRELRLDELVAERHAAGVPVLGICLGLQLLFDSTTELGGADGLGLLPGEVSELRAGDLKVPHIGWSPVRWERESRLTEGIASETPFYFVHSFAPRPGEADLLGSAAYGERFACAAERGNVFGVQFHPEKSSAAGLRLLSNFAGVCARNPVPT
jgi:glutamine amidotransferase